MFLNIVFIGNVLGEELVSRRDQLCTRLQIELIICYRLSEFAQADQVVVRGVGGGGCAERTSNSTSF